MAERDSQKQKDKQSEQTPKYTADLLKSDTVHSLSSARVLQLLLAYRLVNALTNQTFFQPDEYYQALEPAWNSAFGADGHAWITWEWYAHLRSSLHPTLFALAYRAADLIAGSIKAEPSLRAELLLAAPKVLQAVIAAIGDYFTWKLAQGVYGATSEVSLTALILTVSNPWQWFCSTRTFSNGMETTLTAAALCQWPFSWEQLPELQSDTKSSERSPPDEDINREIVSSPKTALLLAAFATLLRPTNVIIWISLTLYAFTSSRREVSTSSTPSQSDIPPNKSMTKVPSKTKTTSPSLASGIVLTFLYNGIGCGLLALLISITSDYLFFNQLTFPPLNFLVFNVLKSLAVFYGNNDWHYYLSQGYPLLLTTALPFTIIGMYEASAPSMSFQQRTRWTQVVLRGLVLISFTLPAALSILAHKEVRFIYPLLPVFQVLAAGPLWQFFGPIMRRGHNVPPTTILTMVTKRGFFAVLLTLNAIIAIYTSQVHNSGLITLPNYLRKEYETHYILANKQPVPDLTQPMTVAFLMPCHSVPWRSHLQYTPALQEPGIKAWALTCEPPLHIDDSGLKARYRDEADLFYDDPTGWIRTNMARSTPEGIIDNRGTTARRAAGVYPGSSAGTKKKLWGKMSDLDQRGVDITDLLPYLSTWQPSSSSVTDGSKLNEDETTPSKNAPPTNQLRTASVTGQSPSSAHYIRRPWPHYIAFFEQLEHTMQSILRGSAYRECWRTFNSHWHDDWRRTGDIIVWCLRPKDSNDGEDKVLDTPDVLARQRVVQDKVETADAVTDQKRDNANKGRDRQSSGQRALDMLNENQE